MAAGRIGRRGRSMNGSVFDLLESRVRSYSRRFPAVFERARGAVLVDTGGRRYLDFFSGAGALNYGHNEPHLKRRVIEYLEGDGIVHALDMATAAKAELLEGLQEVILAPRGLDYRIQFPGPTGTNAVEAALKLARKVTGRTTVVAFANGFHGMTLGSLAATGNRAKRSGAGLPLTGVVPMAYDGDLGSGIDSLEVLEFFLSDPGSGLDLPAAVIVETVQAEGGVKVAGLEWLRRLERLAHDHGALLILDDIQTGCGRTGPFFSFEPAGIRPDIVCLSKSLSGFGLPLALVLLRPELDVWEPGEHNGTFRGNNLAFVTATEALRFWRDDGLSRAVEAKAAVVRERLHEALADSGLPGEVRGRGLLQGLVLPADGTAGRVSAAAFERGLLVETAGPRDEVVKLLPPLVIPDDELAAGLDTLAGALAATASGAARARAVHA